MTDPFLLPTLNLGTSLDQPIEPLAVPGVLAQGSAEAMYVLDGVNRAPHRLARISRPAGVMGVRLADPGIGVRITLQLLVDTLSTRMWQEHHAGLVGGLVEPEDALPDVSERHRLVEISVQGRTRGVLMLSLRPDDPDRVSQQFQVELAPEEVDASGLVMIGFEPPADPPSWMCEGLMPDGSVGLCVVRLRVEPLEEPVGPRLSSGRPRERGRGVVEPGAVGFVVNPAERSGTMLSLRPRVAGEEHRLRGRRSRLRHPVRAVRQEVDDRRGAGLGTAAVDVVGPAGAVHSGVEVTAKDGEFALELPRSSGPFYVRARLRDRRGRDVAWAVRTESM